MSPIQTAIREQSVDRKGPLPRHAPADILFSTPKDAAMEIVVDWQLPSELENRRR